MKTSQQALSALSDEAAREFDEIGPRWGEDINKHRDLVIRRYAPLVALSPDSGVLVQRDIAYGTDARQVLDIYRRADWAPGSRDVLLFFHGGAFVRGSKSFDGCIYDNVAGWFAQQGVLALNVEYRLAPGSAWPAGGEDVLLALRWAQAHAQPLGGRPDRIFLMGHSAGGTHVATALFDPAVQRPRADEVAGAMLISGRLKADVLSDNPNAAGVRAYFGADESLYEQRSPMTHAGESNVPLLIAVAQYENPHLDDYGLAFCQRAQASSRTAPTRFVRMARHNHTSIVAHFNSGEEKLGREILDFMAAV